MTSRFLFFLCSALLGAGLAIAVGFYSHNSEVSKDGGQAVADFALIDQSGRFHHLYSYAHAKAIVIYAHALDCPIVDQDVPALKKLKSRFSEQGVEFFMINANPDEPRSRLAEFVDRQTLEISILSDDAQLVTEDLRLLKAGEVIVVDPKTWSVRYRGDVGDRADDANGVDGYLAQALSALISGERVQVANRTGPGCLIDFIDDSVSQHQTISYAQQVEPILRDRCIACHRQGGIGPWAMDSHAALKAWAPEMRRVIMTKTMPPWHADPDVGKFAYDRSLSAAQQRTLIHWIDQGTPAGSGPDPLAETPAPPVEAWPLGEPDMVIKLPTIKIPPTGIFAWQFKKMPLPTTEDKWVRAVHLRPSNKEATHHVFAFVEYPKSAQQQEPDWGQGANSFFAAYVPGMTVHPFPHGSGQFLPKGSVLSFQRHYITIGYPTEDNLELALYFHDKPPPIEYKMVSAINMGINIPPHVQRHVESAQVTLKEEGEMHAIYPHMHYRGKAMSFTAQFPDGRTEPLLSVPNYNFNWQTTYQLEPPKRFPAGTKVSVQAEFDNSANNPVNPNPDNNVKWGMLSDDEMLVGYIVYTTRLAESDSN